MWARVALDLPSQHVSTLVALTVCLSLKLFFVNVQGTGRTKIQVMPTWTHERCYGPAFNKQMTTVFPSRVIMESSWYLKRVSAKAIGEWAPLSANCEADALVDGKTDGFDPSEGICTARSVALKHSAECFGDGTLDGS